MPLVFAPMDEMDLGPCTAIAASAPDPWTRAQLAAELQTPGRHTFVALEDTRPVAFICLNLNDDHASEVLQLAVAPALRRQGYGRALTSHALARLAALGATSYVLDVRASNLAAIALYRRLGFVPVAKRPGLYARPAEDGLTMQKQLQ